MSSKEIVFFSGLPRSGSTVLQTILNQHSDIYATPTSPLLDLLIENQNAWKTNKSVIANPPPFEQLTNVTRAIIESFWKHIDKPIILDKNRGWMKNIKSAEILFEREVKTIITTRDLPSIMASWLKLIHKDNNNIKIDQVIRKKVLNLYF